jgi:hypothetical protein
MVNKTPNPLLCSYHKGTFKLGLTVEPILLRFTMSAVSKYPTSILLVVIGSEHSSNFICVCQFRSKCLVCLMELSLNCIVGETVLKDFI